MFGSDRKLRIFSIFKSVSGETSRSIPQGSVCTFIRFSGCNLFIQNFCRYCDTKYAQSSNSGKWMTVKDVINKVKEIGCREIIITGGEPLMQNENLEYLYKNLVYFARNIVIETNGTIAAKDVMFDDRICNVWFVVDWKTSGSGIYLPMKDRLNILSTFPSYSVIKFVITGKDDFDEAVSAIKKINKTFPRHTFTFAFSPCNGINTTKLYKEMMKHPLLTNAILNVQLHKLLKLPEHK